MFFLLPKHKSQYDLTSQIDIVLEVYFMEFDYPSIKPCHLALFLSLYIILFAEWDLIFPRSSKT